MKRFTGLLIGAIIGAIIGGILCAIINSISEGAWCTEYSTSIYSSPVYLTAIICSFCGLMNADEPFHMVFGSIIIGIIFGILYLIIGAIILFIVELFSMDFGSFAAFFVVIALLLGGGEVVAIIFFD